ncbi:glucose-6-phosphate 1-dehydrogenase [Nematocida major]|uniref:glucose-6-phosphate 1-dehydrogenase n=1 Tax=Nematocida major TaxID=1912982 RepID=UPI0020084F08|nr:glucose-6-phosphate 1-dehydrogenase [Nematocida major]KAH9386994.1 glucose-6-phosphate 1-dehydrogenase [Nematocida major]
MIVIAGCTGDLSKKKIFPAINKVFRRELSKCMGGEYATTELDLTEGTLSSSTSAHNLSKHSPITTANPADPRKRTSYLEATGSRILYKKVPQSDVLKNNSVIVPRIIGYARTPLDTVQFIQRIDPSISYLKETVEKIEYVSGEYAEMVDRICSLPGRKEEGDTPDTQLYFYLAVPPEIYPTVLERVRALLSQEKTSSEKQMPIVLLEKPIGTSLKTFLGLKAYMSDRPRRFLCVDHYMFKNVLVQYKKIFQETFLGEFVQPGSVREVKAYFNEVIGVEGRESYYNTSGACRDVLQNHLLLAVATVLGEGKERLSTLRRIESLSEENTLFGVYKEYAERVKQNQELPHSLRRQNSEVFFPDSEEKPKTCEKEGPKSLCGMDLGGVKETYIQAKTRIGAPWNVPLKLTAGKKMPHHFVAVVLVLEESAILKAVQARTSPKDYENSGLVQKIIKALGKPPSPKDLKLSSAEMSLETDESQDEDLDKSLDLEETSEEEAQEESVPEKVQRLITGKVKIKITPKEAIFIEIKYKEKLAKKVHLTIPGTENNIDAYEHLFSQLVFEREKSGFSQLPEIEEQWRIVDPILDSPKVSRVIY